MLPIKAFKHVKIAMTILSISIIWPLMSLATLSIALAADPEINVTGVADQQFYNTDITPDINITGDYQNEITTLNGEPFVSGAKITAEGDYTLHIYVEEDPSGTPFEKTVNFTIDKTSPVITINTPSNNQHVKGIVQLNASIIEKNPQSVSVRINGNQVATALPSALNTILMPDGIHAISIAATDRAAQTTQKTITVTVDNHNPAGKALINQKSAFTNKRYVNLSLPASDNTGISSMRIRNKGESWSDWQTYNPSRIWRLSPGNGIKTVYVRFRDRAGNTSKIVSDRIVLDAKRPTGTIQINKGAQFTNTRKIVLGISAFDNFRVADMRIKNFGGRWSSWIPYKKIREWKLRRDNGASKVLIQFRDKAGNISRTKKDRVFLDNKSPTISVLAPPSVTTELTNLPIKLQWHSLDPLPSSGIGSHEVQYRIGNNISWAVWLPDTFSNAEYFNAITGFTYYFRARAKDRAGNTGAWSKEAKITIADYYGQFITEPTIVLIRNQQRVRIYNGYKMMVRTFLVSTGKYAPVPGAYRVYSKSPQSRSISGRVSMKHMVRFTRASSGVAIGFHSVIYNNNGVIDLDKLGQPVSAGCVRSDFTNAAFIYNFAPIGTKVWVVK